MNNLLLGLLCLMTLLNACTKTDDINVDDNKLGQVKIKFDHIVGAKKLQLNEGNYSNESGETFNISLLKYFVSNIKFTKTNGDIITIPKEDSYFLIDATDQASLQPILNIPEGDYKTLQFNVGVDSLANTIPIEQRKGVLDASENGMYWEWNSGYIHLKIEGTSPQSPNATKSFKYHIGFFGGYDTPTVNNNRTVKLDLSQAGTSKVQENLSSDIHIMVDLGKIFDGSNTISIKTNPVVMHSGPHSKIADNYATMFRHDHTHNFTKIASNEK